MSNGLCKQHKVKLREKTIGKKAGKGPLGKHLAKRCHEDIK